MGQLQPFSDPTGKMNQTEINTEDISNLMDEFNKSQQSDNLQLSLFSDGDTNRYMVGYLQDGWGEGVNVGIKASKQGVEVTTATDLELTYKDDFSTKTWFDATNSRILLGLLPDGTYGIAISIPGVDVTSAFS